MDEDLGAYCRALEAHLCRVNGGHLVRIVGPAFDLARGWHASGVPLKLALRGIDRRAQRAARSARAGRRPLRLEFCEADVLDVFDEWRRAVGFVLPARSSAEPSAATSGEAADEDAPVAAPGSSPQRGASLPRHFERVAVKLSSFLAGSDAEAALRGAVGQVASEVEHLRGKARSARGAERQGIIDALAALDATLLGMIETKAPASLREAAQAEAEADLSAYRRRLSPPEYQRLRDRAVRHLVRDRLGLPRLTFP